MRSSARRRARNSAIKSRLKTLEKRFRTFAAAGQRDNALSALRVLTSALDKAAKTGVIHRRKADRKKSRLSLRLNSVK